MAGRKNYDSTFDVWMLKNLIDLFMEWRICVAERFGESDEVSPCCRSPY